MVGRGKHKCMLINVNLNSWSQASNGSSMLPPNANTFPLALLFSNITISYSIFLKPQNTLFLPPIQLLKFISYFTNKLEPPPEVSGFSQHHIHKPTQYQYLAMISQNFNSGAVWVLFHASRWQLRAAGTTSAVQSTEINLSPVYSHGHLLNPEAVDMCLYPFLGPMLLLDIWSRPFSSIQGYYFWNSHFFFYIIIPFLSLLAYPHIRTNFL